MLISPFSAAHGRVSVVIDEPTLTLATWQKLVIARWRSAPTATTVRAMREALVPYVGRSDAFGAINIVEIADAGTLPDDARHEVVATQRLFAAKQRALATVIRGDGFWAATIRSVAAGLAVLGRVDFPQRVFHDIDPAVRWLAPKIPGLGTETVPAAIEAVTSIQRG